MKYPLLAIPFTTALLLSACGGSSSGGDNVPIVAPLPPPPPVIAAPAVTSLNPSSGPAAGGTRVVITGTDLSGATIVKFGAVSATSFTVDSTTQITAISPLAAAAAIVDVVVTTASGASTTAAADQFTYLAPSAEGAWQGTTGDGRAISGVVTKEGDYWLAYTQSGNAAIVGFYAGRGISTPTDASAGTFASQNLREVNFAGGFTGGGDVAEGAISSASFSNKAALSGSFATVAGGAVTSATFSVESIGNLNVPSTPPAPPNPPLAAGPNHSTVPGTAILEGSGTLTVDINITNQISVNGTAPSVIAADTHAVFTGVLTGSSFAWTAGTSTASNCHRLSGANICGFIPTTPESATYDQNPIAFDLSVLGAQTIITKNAADPTNLTTYTFTATGITLSSLPAITADTFNFATYNVAYDAAPALTEVAGNYTGSAGVGVATQAGATFNIAADGAISGGELSASHCAYTGTASTHPAGGNVYDISLTFSDSGGACAYSASGSFTGVATYDTTMHTATVMALDSSREQGFLFVGTKP